MAEHRVRRPRTDHSFVVVYDVVTRISATCPERGFRLGRSGPPTARPRLGSPSRPAVQSLSAAEAAASAIRTGCVRGIPPPGRAAPAAVVRTALSRHQRLQGRERCRQQLPGSRALVSVPGMMQAAFKAATRCRSGRPTSRQVRRGVWRNAPNDQRLHDLTSLRWRATLVFHDGRRRRPRRARSRRAAEGAPQTAPVEGPTAGR